MPSDPLIIDVMATDGYVSVSNTLHPRRSGGTDESSTHVGLNYIRQQYMDLSGMDIEIHEAGNMYTVTLPLI